jgi:hypothetical protein
MVILLSPIGIRSTPNPPVNSVSVPGPSVGVPALPSGGVKSSRGIIILEASSDFFLFEVIAMQGKPIFSLETFLFLAVAFQQFPYFSARFQCSAGTLPEGKVGRRGRAVLLVSSFPQRRLEALALDVKAPEAAEACHASQFALFPGEFSIFQVCLAPVLRPIHHFIGLLNLSGTKLYRLGRDGCPQR